MKLSQFESIISVRGLVLDDKDRSCANIKPDLELMDLIPPEPTIEDLAVYFAQEACEVKTLEEFLVDGKTIFVKTWYEEENGYRTKTFYDPTDFTSRTSCGRWRVE